MDTIKQRIKPVVIAGATGPRTITVRRLAWKAARQFIRDIFGSAAELFGGQDSVSIYDRLPSIIQKSDDLTAKLIAGSTDLTPEELDALDWGDVLALLDAALEVNTDAEIKNFCAGIAEKVKGFVASQKTKAPASSTPTC